MAITKSTHEKSSEYKSRLGIENRSLRKQRPNSALHTDAAGAAPDSGATLAGGAVPTVDGDPDGCQRRR